MAIFHEFLVSDLDKLSADELRSKGVIQLKDPENMTAEHVERLKALVNGLDDSHALNLGAVDDKLRNLGQAAPACPRSPPSLGSTTPDPNDEVENEAFLQECLRVEHKAYHDLIMDGGQPSHRPEEGGFDILDNPGEYTDIIRFWTPGSHMSIRILQNQLYHWQDFRIYQERWRKRFWKPAWFQKRVQFIKKYRSEKGLEGDICLRQDRKAQSRLGDWKEFQFWEYRKADGFVREMEKAARDKKASESRLQAAIAMGQSADDIQWIREQGVALHEGRWGGAKIELERQKVFLEWINEQIPIIAFECRQSEMRQGSQTNNHGSIESTHLGKRKRSSEDITTRDKSYRKVSKVIHEIDPTRAAEVDKPACSATSSIPDIDDQNATIIGQQRKDSEVVACSNPAVVSVQSRVSNSQKVCRSSEKPIRVALDSAAAKISKCFREVLPEPATFGVKKSSFTRRSLRKAGGRVQEGTRRDKYAAANDPKHVSLQPVPYLQSPKAGTRGLKARARRTAGVLPEYTETYERVLLSPRGEQLGRKMADGGPKITVQMPAQEQCLTKNLLRRSQRILQRPRVVYLVNCYYYYYYYYYYYCYYYYYYYYYYCYYY